MKKLFFMMLVGVGIASLKGHVTITPDNQIHLASWSFPVPAAVQSSPIYPMLATVMMGQLQAPGQAAAASQPYYGTAQPGQVARPALPNVTNASGTYNPNAPTAGQGQAGDPFNAAARGLH